MDHSQGRNGLFYRCLNFQDFIYKFV